MFDERNNLSKDDTTNNYEIEKISELKIELNNIDKLLNDISKYEIEILIKNEEIKECDDSILNYEKDLSSKREFLKEKFDVYIKVRKAFFNLYEQLNFFKNEIRNEVSDILKNIRKLPKEFRPSEYKTLKKLKGDLYLLKNHDYKLQDLFSLTKTTKDLVKIRKMVKSQYDHLLTKDEDEILNTKTNKFLPIKIFGNFINNKKKFNFYKTQGILLKLEIQIDKLLNKIENNLDKMEQFYQDEKRYKILENEIIKIQDNIDKCESTVRLNINKSIKFSALKEKGYYEENHQLALTKVFSSIEKITEALGIKINVSTIYDHKDAINTLKEVLDKITELELDLFNDATFFNPEISLYLQINKNTLRELWPVNIISNDHQYLSYFEFINFGADKNKPIALKYKSKDGNPIAFLLGNINPDGSLYVHQFGVNPLYSDYGLAEDLFQVFLSKDYQEWNKELFTSKIIFDVSEYDQKNLELMANLKKEANLESTAKLKINFFGKQHDAYRFILNCSKN